MHCKVVAVCGKVAAAVGTASKALFDWSKLENKNEPSSIKRALNFLSTYTIWNVKISSIDIDWCGAITDIEKRGSF